MKADYYLLLFLEGHKQKGIPVLLTKEATENGKDIISMEIQAPQSTYYLSVYSNSSTKQILFFRIFGEIDYILNTLNQTKTRNKFHGLDVLMFKSKLGNLLTLSEIMIVPLSKMERTDKLTEEDIKEFSKHFSINRIIGILNKPDWTSMGVRFLHEELGRQKLKNQFESEKEKEIQDSRNQDDWVKDCLKQARGMGYAV